jgi:uncharacterized protein (TIGR03435 family)
MFKHVYRAICDDGWRSRMMRQAVLASFAAAMAAVGALSASVSTAQQPQPAKSLRFEVAAIKPGDPKLEGFSSFSPGPPGGQFQLVNTPLKQWVEMGLSVRDSALKAPAWLDTSRFNLDARMPAGEPASPEMLKALLVERFGLKWHEETQTVPGYELVADKKVLIEPSSEQELLKGHGSGSGPTMIQGTNMPMPELAEALAKALGKPVADATHLPGVFSFRLMWRPDSEAVAAEQKQHGIDVDNLPDSVFTALREQLGLRLQSAEVPSKVIVVDHIDSQPTGN